MLLPYVDDINNGGVVLASASPRRKELLERMGVKFSVVVSDFAENLDKKSFLDNPAHYPLATARAKGEDVLRKVLAGSSPPPRLIISADTIVLPDGGSASEILEKAESPGDCIKMIQQLQGKRHRVITGVVLLFPLSGPGGVSKEFTETTYVYFEPLDDETVTLYATKHPEAWQGKAGAYGVQDLAATFISRIEGDYYNVMGFPVCAISGAMREAHRKGYFAQ